MVIPLVGHQLIRLAADAVTYPLLVVSTRMVAQNAFGNDKNYTGTYLFVSAVGTPNMDPTKTLTELFSLFGHQISLD